VVVIPIGGMNPGNKLLQERMRLDCRSDVRVVLSLGRMWKDDGMRVLAALTPCNGAIWARHRSLQPHAVVCTTGAAAGRHVVLQVGHRGNA
jgi:hypothetical protein